MDRHHKEEFEVLKFIFNKVSENIADLKLSECENTTTCILEKLCITGLMTGQERQYVVSCETKGDKNK